MPTATRRPQLLAQLSDGIAKLTTSEQWRRYLDFQSRFHSYSWGNVLLIAAQRPAASQVAGFHAWRKMGRHVVRGEKAIWILAPMSYRRDSADNTDDERVIRGWKFVPVFDVAQTDGEELPSVCDRLEGDAPAGVFAQLTTVAQSLGFRVELAHLDGSVNGDCSHLEHRIRVRPDVSTAQQVKTLAHEVAHAILHECCEDRGVAELEAESTAYVVCQALGIDSSNYSFGYVASWAGGGDRAITAIKASCDHIQKAAAQILGAFEAGQEELD